VSHNNNFPQEVDAMKVAGQIDSISLKEADVMNVSADSVATTIGNTMTEWQNKSVRYEEGEEGECKDNWHEYKHYKKCMPKWEIAPDPTVDSSDYWQWFMYTYCDELLEFHGANLPDIPASWRTITAERAKESLRNHYN